MKFPQPRSYSILLRCKRQCGITGRGCLLDAHSLVRNGTSVICVTTLDDLNLCFSRNLGCSLGVLGRITWLTVSPLTGPVIVVRMAAANGPLAPPTNNCSSCVASREEPSPCCTRRTLDHTPACSETCLNTEQTYFGQLTVCPRTKKASANTAGIHHMQQRIAKRHGHTRLSQCPCIAHCRSAKVCAEVQVRRRTVYRTRTSEQSSWRLTLPSASHREPGPLDTHASM